MIYASWELLYTQAPGGVDTRSIFTFDLDFRSLFQIDPDRQVVLAYAAVAGHRSDAVPANINYSPTQARLIGRFNETFNIGLVPSAPAAGIPNWAVTPFPGISFSEFAPFRAPETSKILMPATFQVELQRGQSASQLSAGDTVRFLLTLGYRRSVVNKSWNT